MLDIKKITEDIDGTIKALETRGKSFSYLKEIKTLNDQRLELLTVTEEAKAKINTESKKIGQLKSKGEDASGVLKEVSKLKDEIAGKQEKLNEIQEKINEMLLTTPNVPRGTVPIGKSEKDNVEVSKSGTPTKFSFKHKAHWDIAKDLDIIDFDRATKMSGSRFVLYKGLGAKLERAIQSFMLDKHTAKGYTEIMPPLAVLGKTLVGTGQLPNFEEDLFKLNQNNLYLIPTGEVPLTYLHANEIIPEDQLPVAYTTLTPCFRSEAGSSGRDVKGIIRLHQFNKVELFKLTKLENIEKELQILLKDAQEVLDDLKLPYRTVALCTGDMGFHSEQTFDIEVWMPSYDEYKEISSCSSFGDYQGRRCMIRTTNGKNKEYLGTINGSGLATGRTMAAIIENYQNEDGSITVPDVLVPYMNGIKIIK